MDTNLTNDIKFQAEYKEGVNESDNTSTIITIDQNQSSPFPIKVFNEDYIEQNIDIKNSTTNVISVHLGHENIELAQQIESDQKELRGSDGEIGVLAKIREKEKEKTRLEKECGEHFTAISKTIGAAISGSANAPRNYRAPNARNDFDIIPRNILPDQEMQVTMQTLKQESKDELTTIGSHFADEQGSQGEFIDLFKRYLHEAEALCQETVESRVIDRLAQNPDIAQWVEDGQKIHQKHVSSNCEYCRQTIPEHRIREISSHFNDADRELKQKLESAIHNFKNFIHQLGAIHFHDKLALYNEYQNDFSTKISMFHKEVSLLSGGIAGIIEKLNEKKLTPFNQVIISKQPSLDGIKNPLIEINQIIEDHNAKSAKFAKHQQDAIIQIKGHYFSTIEADVSDCKQKIVEHNEQINQLQKQSEELKKRITSALAQISSTHKACESINKDIHNFLGRQELTLSPADDSVTEGGYQILRHGNPAKNLSEGEKTALALVYFLVNLNDGQADIEKTIVVIDDPVSSLDSNSLYQAFSFLKNGIQDCYQIFIFTHNFSFLRLLLNWRERLKKKTGYYMIKNEIINEKRAAKITTLDKALRENETEYIYLYKVLRKYLNNQNQEIMSAYPMPNLARKFWESFLVFFIPSNQSMYKRMDVLKKEYHEVKKFDAIYKFTNDQSHITGAGFDPSLVPEAEKAIKNIFCIIKKVAPLHYQQLEKSIDSNITAK